MSIVWIDSAINEVSTNQSDDYML